MSELQDRLVRSQKHAETGPVIYFGLLLEGYLGNLFYRRPPPPRPYGGSLLLNLGCGNKKYEGWVNADFFNFHDYFGNKSFVPDWMLDLRKPIRCSDNYWDGIFTEHTLEHLTYENNLKAIAEMFRILKPGAWIRIVVPDIEKYINHYTGKAAPKPFENISRGAETLAGVTQGWGHKSVWDESLLCAVLSDRGFVNVAARAFGEGSEPRILKDSASRAWESLYVEGQKPT